MHVDDNIDYDDLGDPNQRTQYDAKITGLKVNIGHWKYLEQGEQDPTKNSCIRQQRSYVLPKSRTWK